MLEEILATLKKRQGKPVGRGATDTVSDTVKVLLANPKITIDALAHSLKKSRRTITRIIKKLQEDGIISRVGSDKTGYWQIKNE